MPRGHIYSDLEWNFIGLTYWMDAHRELAIDYWRYTTRLLSANRVTYSLQGGGIETGLLLWFGAVHEGVAEDLELVRHLYQKRLASSYWAHDLSSWPGPIARFFLPRSAARTCLEQRLAPRSLVWRISHWQSGLVRPGDTPRIGSTSRKRHLGRLQPKSMSFMLSFRTSSPSMS